MNKIDVAYIDLLDISGMTNTQVTVSENLMTLTPLPSDESDYERGMRRAMQKIAASCGRVFGADVGYEDLPDLVESIVRSKKESTKPKPTKFVKVEESIFDLKEEFENGELYFRWLGNGEQGSGGVGYDQIDDINMLLVRWEEKRVYRQVEVDWRDEVSVMVKAIGLSYSNNGRGNITGMIWDKESEFIAICHRVAELTDKPE